MRPGTDESLGDLPIKLITLLPTTESAEATVLIPPAFFILYKQKIPLLPPGDTAGTNYLKLNSEASALARLEKSLAKNRSYSNLYHAGIPPLK